MAEEAKEKAPAAKTPKWECQLDWASVDAVTVGTVGSLTCTGGFVPAFVESKDKNKALLVLPEGTSKHALKVLQVKQLESTRADLLVTSHVAGDFKNQKIKLVTAEGVTGFESNPLEWSVASVLEAGKPPEPIGSFGPYTLSWPLWLIILIALVLANIVFFSIRRARAYKKHRELVKELERHGTALTPYQTFNKALRASRKVISPLRAEEKYEDGQSNEHKAILSIHDAFNEYTMRMFVIPSKELSQRKLVQQIKRKMKFKFDEVNKPLAKLLREFERSEKAATIDPKDVEQIANMTQEIVDKIDNLQKKKRRGA